MAFYMRHVGGGHFGDVYKTRYEGQWAAVKRVPQDRITVQHIEREWRICQQVNHDNVVKILGMPWLAESIWHIPLEFINGETLEMTIFERRKSNIQLTSSNKATIIAGMCEGLHYLHKKCIVHQDLKPDNIMVEHGTLRAVIIDLGLAKLYCGGSFSSATDMGDKNYSAPEIFSGHSRDMRSDVWAMGKVIGEVLLLTRLPTRSLSSAMIKERLRFQPYCDLVSEMVEENPALRSTMAGVIKAIGPAGKADTRGSSSQTSVRDVRVDLALFGAVTVLGVLLLLILLK